MIHNRPGWPLLKHDALIAKTRVLSAITELTPRKKNGRGKKSLSPSVRDNCRLCMVSSTLLWDRVCEYHKSTIKPPPLSFQGKKVKKPPPASPPPSSLLKPTRDPSITIAGSQLTRLARFSYNGKVDFCCV